MKFFKEVTSKFKNFITPKEIIEQASLLKIISENSDDVIWIYDLNGKHFTYVSSSVKKLRGYEVNEALAQDIFDKLTPESKKYVSEQIPQRIAAIEAGDFSLKVAKDRIFQLHQDGSIIPTEVITTFMTNGRGKVTKLIGISRDISENLEAEEKIRKAYNELANKYNELQAVKEELQISSDYIKNVFDSVSDAIIICDVNLANIVDVNQRMCSLFGYSYQEAINLNFGDVSFNSESDYEIINLFNKAHSEKIQNVELLLKKKTGESFWGGVSFRNVKIGNKEYIVVTIADITEQKNITIALQESRNQLQSVLDTSLDAITLTNYDGIFLACNKTLLNRWKKKRTELLGHSASEVLPPHIFTDRVNKTRKCIESGEGIYFIDNYNDHYFENTISPIIESNGKATAVALFSRDITEKKLAELKLIKEHDLLVNILESTSDGFISIDFNQYCTYINDNAARIFNLTPKEIIGKNIWLDFPDEISQFLVLNFEKALEEKVSVHTEIFFPPLDKWFEERIFPYNDGLAIFFQDITERKKATEVIEESEARYRKLFENNPLPMLIYERNTFIMLAVNEAFRIHYGYNSEEISSLVLMDLYPEDEKEKIKNVALNLTGHANVGEWHHIRKDGTIITIIAQSHDLNYIGRSARVAVITDISDRKLIELEIIKLNKELENRVAQRTAQLESAYKDMESFSYSVSHDLRAPLRAITGFSEIISRRYRTNLNPETQHYLDNILKASNRMAHLIDDLLIYSRLGRQGVKITVIPLTNIFDLVINDFSIQLKEVNGIIEIEKDLPPVEGDRSLLTRIFTNLIENAIKYRNIDVNLLIKIWSESCDDKIKIFIQDNGIGISQEHHKRIFNIFQRLHSEDKYPGTGIGLSTVKKSAELINGNIFIESEPGKGSTFIVELIKGNL